jgi:hypothetical protein
MGNQSLLRLANGATWMDKGKCSIQREIRFRQGNLHPERWPTSEDRSGAMSDPISARLSEVYRDSDR